MIKGLAIGFLFVTALNVQSFGAELKVKHHSVGSKTHTWVMTYGIEGESLLFYGVNGKPRGPDKTGIGPIIGAEGKVWTVDGKTKSKIKYFLGRSDGTEEKVPAKKQLFQLLDGKWTEAEANISKAEFMKFLSQRGERDYSIEALLKFVAKGKEKGAAQAESIDSTAVKEGTRPRHFK